MTQLSDQPYNLTRSLGFNAYHVLAADSSESLQTSLEYLNKKYATAFLIDLLEKSAQLIGAKVLNLSSEQYVPHGASVALLLADEGQPDGALPVQTNTILGHLDKSHLTVHTYPQIHPDTGLCSLRLDLDLATCGSISPLATLPLLFEQIVCDVATIDFRIRGYQQSTHGQLEFGSDEIRCISEHLPAECTEQYLIKNLNTPEALFYHTRMIRKTINPLNHRIPEKAGLDASSNTNLEPLLKSLFYG